MRGSWSSKVCAHGDHGSDLGAADVGTPKQQRDPGGGGATQEKLAKVASLSARFLRPVPVPAATSSTSGPTRVPRRSVGYLRHAGRAGRGGGRVCGMEEATLGMRRLEATRLSRLRAVSGPPCLPTATAAEATCTLRCGGCGKPLHRSARWVQQGPAWGMAGVERARLADVEGRCWPVGRGSVRGQPQGKRQRCCRLQGRRRGERKRKKK